MATATHESRCHRILMLHDFLESPRIGMQTANSRYLISLNTFSQSLELSLKAGAVLESLGSDVNQLPNGDIEITHDDGGGSALLLAQALSRLQIRATFFVITSKIGKYNYLSSQEILQINAMGHRIGSHSDTHPSPFCELSELKIHSEVMRSKSILEELLNTEVSTFAIPGGEIRRKTLEILSDPILGLRRVYTSTPYRGIFRTIRGVEFAGRLCIERTMCKSQIFKIMIGKTWFARRLDYQARRLRLELKYSLRKIDLVTSSSGK